jgi:Fe-S-cluster containining protein
VEKEVSYRCTKCKTVCNHSQIRVVTETRERNYPKSGREIAKEEALCRECAVEMKINVPPVRETMPNGQGAHAEGETKSVLIGSV